MLKPNEIQALYEEVRPDGVADMFSYTGLQLNAIIPALKRMEIFSGVEFEVMETPLEAKDDGSGSYVNRAGTVRLDNSFMPNSRVRIYSVMFAPGTFVENEQNMPHGVYILPPRTSERDFKLKRSILTEIELERIQDARFHSEAIIEPEGQMIDNFTSNAVRIGELKANLLRDYAMKLDKIFAMDFNQFKDTSISDVQRFGKVFIRVTDDSYHRDPNENGTWENNCYFRVIEPVGELPF